MLISLVGIIWIQSAWIGGAIHARHRDFRFHVNLALNKVNSEIEKEEAVVILEKRLGKVDSLLETLVVFEEEDSNHMIINLPQKESDSERQIEIKIENDGKHSRIHTQISRRLDTWVEDEHRLIGPHPDEAREEREQRIFRLREATERKEEHMKAMFRHLSYERMFGAELSDRISFEDLTKKIRLALNEEGIAPNFEYAVFNRKKGQFEKGYQTANFEVEKRDETLKKNLFEGEMNFLQDYEVWLQPKDKSGYIWRGVQGMTMLSILFTLLILCTFSASLYFILKQKKISQVKNDFINNMTHELKTPLASISLASSSISHPEIIQHPEEIKKYTEIIKEEEKRINAHVERVLNIAALDRGEFELNKEKINFFELVQTACRSFELALQEKEGSCVVSKEGEQFNLQGDAFHLANVCSNLIDNALKYSNPGVRIELSLKESKQYIEFQIKDTGIGMTAREQKLAFDKFYRAETGNIHTQKGFGLGLSYVKSIVERHKGSVDLSSIKGRGTTVTLKIPK